MNKIKHIFITLLLLCIGVVKGYAYSFSYDGIYYNILSTTDKTVEVTYCELMNSYTYNYSGDIVIPQFVNYNNDTYRVVRISDYAFQHDNITSIVLPEGLKSIGDYAFNLCKNLTSIELPDGLTSIGDYAFSGCDLTSIELPNGLESIGSYAFLKCNILSVTIPASVLTFADSAFELAKKIIFLGNTRPSGISQNFTNSNMPICYVSSKANYGFGIEYANLSSMFEVGG